MKVRKGYVIVSFFLLLALLAVLFHCSKLAAVNECLAQHDIGVREVIIAGTSLRWSLAELSVTDNVPDSGWRVEDFSSAQTVYINGNAYAPCDLINAETGKLPDGLKLLTVTINVVGDSGYKPGKDKINEYFYPHFLKLANKTDINSFFSPYLCAASAQDNLDRDANTGNERATYRLAFFLDDRVSVKNGCLFSSIVPTQNLGVCIQLQENKT